MESAQQTPAPSRGRRDKWIKIGFVAAVVVIGLLVYQGQRKDPELPGFGRNMQAALDAAKQKRTCIVVLVTNQPMSYDDKDVVTNYMTHPQVQAALVRSGYLPVHLTVRDPWVAANGVKQTPAYLLVDPDGKVIRRHEGSKLNNPNFISEFLTSGAESAPAKGP